MKSIMSRRRRAETVAMHCLMANLLACLFACERQPQTAVPSLPGQAAGGPKTFFQEIAARAGVTFTWHSGHDGRQHYLPESIGGGGGFFDYNNDGFIDIYFVQAGSIADPSNNEPNQLLRNRGDGTFEPVPDAAGMNHRGYGMGLACGDYNNDGHVDLYLTNLGPNVLYRNNGDGTFTDVTIAAGVECPRWSTGAAWLDIDNDNDLDLYVVNYINWSIETEQSCYNSMGAPDYCAPVNYNAPAMDTLYRNNGDGTFSDITQQAGLDLAFGNGLGIVADDFNNDGWIDIFIANDGNPNQLWVNQKNGTFGNVAPLVGVAVDEEGIAKAGMGVDSADLNGDDRLDLIVVNLRRESDSLFINQGRSFFDGTSSAGLRAITRGFTRFGAGLIDFDNDGRLDLYETCGRVQREDHQHASDHFAEPNLLFRGVHSGESGGAVRFEEVKPRGGTAEPLIHASRAAAFGDINNDGGVDVLVINRDAPAYLLKNSEPDRGNWIMLRVQTEHGRDAYGAVIRAKIADAPGATPRTILRTARSTYSYLAANDARVHIGLGAAKRLDDVTITWPGGATRAFGSLEHRKIHTLRPGVTGTVPRR